MSSPAHPLIGFPRESLPGDRRTLLTPEVATILRTAGFDIITEAGIGTGVFYDDTELAAAGVRFASDDEVWAAPLVLRYRCADPAELVRLRPDQSIGAVFHAEGNPALLAALTACRATAYSYEFVEEAGSFPLAAPGGEIAGVQAILHGAQALQTIRGGRGVLLGKVAGAAPARVVVIGCGNVGAAAARTAAALGARVTVLARSQESRRRYLSIAPPGVQVVVNTAQARRTALATADLVVGAILVSTFDTPPMITETDLREMQPGAVMLDATCGYGGGYLPTAGPVQRPGDPPKVTDGILHVKIDTLPALVPVTATEAYAANAAPYLVRMARVALLGASDPAIAAARIAHQGQLVHSVCRQHAAFYGASA